MSIGVPFLMGIDEICSPDFVVIGKAKGITSSRSATLRSHQTMGCSLIDSYARKAQVNRDRIVEPAWDGAEVPSMQPGYMSYCPTPQRRFVDLPFAHGQLRSQPGFVPEIQGVSPSPKGTNPRSLRWFHVRLEAGYCI